MNYRITARTRVSFLDERGIAVDGYRVHFLMEDGTADYVEIPKNQYTKSNVKEAIEATIDRHLDVISGD